MRFEAYGERIFPRKLQGTQNHQQCALKLMGEKSFPISFKAPTIQTQNHQQCALKLMWENSFPISFKAPTIQSSKRASKSINSCLKIQEGIWTVGVNIWIMNQAFSGLERPQHDWTPPSYPSMSPPSVGIPCCNFKHRNALKLTALHIPRSRALFGGIWSALLCGQNWIRKTLRH